MKKKRMATLLPVILIFTVIAAASARSATLDETFKQCVSDLRKNPSDDSLREKIIKLAQEMKPAPEIPEEAREHFVMATVLQKEAKDSKGYKLAIKEYMDALLIAPWWPEAYSNLAILQKMDGKYDDAIQTLNFYLLTNPSDARNAKDEIYRIKAAKKMTETENAAKAEKAEMESRKVDFSGRWKDPSDVTCWAYKFVISGNEITIRQYCGEMEDGALGWVTLNGRSFTGKRNTSPSRIGGSGYPGRIEGKISDDNKVIHMTVPWRDGPHDMRLLRQ